MDCEYEIQSNEMNSWEELLKNQNSFIYEMFLNFKSQQETISNEDE